MTIRATHLWVAGFAVSAFVVGAVPAASLADVDKGEAPSLSLDLNSLDDIRDGVGNAVAIRGDERENAIRKISGALSNGELFEVMVYYAADRKIPAIDDVIALANRATNPKASDSGVPEEGRPSEPSLAPFVAVGVTSTSIAATWDPGVEGELYSLSAGEKLVAVGDAPSGLTLTGLEPGVEYSVSLGTIGIRATPKLDVPSSISTNLTITTLDAEGAADSFELETQLLSPPLSTTDLNYRTFLPYQTINDSPFLGDAAAENACLALNYGLDFDLYSFGGDFRSYQPPQPYKDYRTVMSATYDWTSSQFVAEDADVGLTTVIRLSDMTTVDSRQASTDNMTFDVIAELPGYGEIDFYHVANDPYCPAVGPLFLPPVLGSISYIAAFGVYNDGQVLVSAALALMPAHEVWTQSNDSGRWKNLFTSDATNLSCLASAGLLPGCGAIVTGSTDATACVVDLQPINTTLTDPWYLSDVPAREIVMSELSLPSISSFTIGNARDLTRFPGYYNWNEIQSIDGLEQAANLELFSLSDYSTVCSLAPIEGLTGINHMYAGVGEVDNLSPLSNLTNLGYLRLSNWNASLSYLSNMVNLEYLSIAWGTVPSIAPLAQLTSLDALSLAGVSVADYSPLYNLPSLEYVDIRYSGATPAQISALQAQLPAAYIDY